MLDKVKKILKLSTSGKVAQWTVNAFLNIDSQRENLFAIRGKVAHV